MYGDGVLAIIEIYIRQYLFCTWGHKNEITDCYSCWGCHWKKKLYLFFFTTQRTLQFSAAGGRKNNKFLEEVMDFHPLIQHGPHRKKKCAQQFLYCVFIAAVTFLPSRCPATIVRYTYSHTDWWEGIMKYDVETLKCHDVHTKFHKDWLRK
jgi:hypothetical protein